MKINKFKAINALAESSTMPALWLSKLILPLAPITIFILYLHICKKCDDAYCMMLGGGTLLLFSALLLLNIRSEFQQMRIFADKIKLKRSIIFAYFLEEIIVIYPVILLFIYAINIYWYHCEQKDLRLLQLWSFIGVILCFSAVVITFASHKHIKRRINRLES